MVKGIAELPSDTVIDGEIVALDETGKPSFNLLQGFGGEATAIVLYAFDLLMWQGKDVRLWPLEERREQLREATAATSCTLPTSAPASLRNSGGPCCRISKSCKFRDARWLILSRPAALRFRRNARRNAKRAIRTGLGE